MDPVKVNGDTMSMGRGASSNRRLVVSYLSRSDNQEMPTVAFGLRRSLQFKLPIFVTQLA